MAKVLQDFLDLKVHLDLKEQQEAPDLRETVVFQDPLGHQDLQENFLFFPRTFCSRETPLPEIRERFEGTAQSQSPGHRRTKMWT